MSNMHECPICLDPFKADDLCATDIDLGICHFACLAGSPVVDLETGEPSSGKIDSYRYDARRDDPTVIRLGPVPVSRDDFPLGAEGDAQWRSLIAMATPAVKAGLAGDFAQQNESNNLNHTEKGR